MNELIKFIFESKLIDASTEIACTLSLGIATALAPIFFGITLAYSFVKQFLFNDGSNLQIIKTQLFRMFFIYLFALGMYKPAMGSIAHIADILVSATDITSPAYLEAKKGYMNEIGKNIAADIPADPEISEGIPGPNTETKSTSLFNFSAAQFVSGLWNAFWLFGMAVVKLIVVGVALLFGKILYVIGPLAIVFSMLPFAKEKINAWFGIYLNVLLTPLVTNLLDIIAFGIIAAAGVPEFSTTLPHNIYAVGVFNLILILGYASSFWLTSYIVGSEQGGKMLSLLTTTATTVATMGKSMALQKGVSGISSALSGGGDPISKLGGAADSAK